MVPSLDHDPSMTVTGTTGPAGGSGLAQTACPQHGVDLGSRRLVCCGRDALVRCYEVV
jgi:hypothetical protein